MRFLILVSLLIILPTTLAAEAIDTKCIEKAAHESITAFLVDRTDTLEDKDGFTKSVTVLKEMIQPGERLLVAASTDKAGDARILMDYVRPSESVWTSTLKIRAQQKKFNECVDAVTQELVSKEEKHDHSALFETITFFGKVLASDSSAKKRLILYSDMMQNSSVISFYTQKSFNVEAILKLVEKEHLVATLGKVEVLAAGVGAHITDKKARELEEFWGAYFGKAGANLKFFGPLLISMG